jgi:SNF2 family DNA or RNA helicase
MIASNASAPRWERHEHGVRLVLPDGTVRQPSALDVFGSVFRKRGDVAGLHDVPSAATELPDIRFSQFPADLVLRIFGQAPEPARLGLGAMIEGKCFPIEPDQDQLLVNSVWCPVSADELDSVTEWLRSSALTPGDAISLGQILRLRLLLDPPAKIIDDYLVGDSPALGGDVSSIANLQATLYPYQERGVAFLRFVAGQDIGCVLADEMGLGKTLQVIALFAAEVMVDRKPNLVICPGTLVENWRRELARFAPTLSVLIHTGQDRAGTAKGFAGADVVVTTYDTTIRDVVLLESVDWNVVAADEAQAIKNPDAQRTAALKTLPRRVSIAVTGTPVENRLQDLWSICDFALPGLLGRLEQFTSKFDDEVSDARRLGDVVAPLILRRRVAEVAKDLPERIEIPQPIYSTDDFGALYEAVRQEALHEYGAGAGIVATTKLRMLCTHPSLVVDWHSDPTEGVPKLQRLLEILEEIFLAGEKAIIFTTYQKMTDLILKCLREQWQSGHFNCIDGRIPIEERQGAVDLFAEHTGYGALVLNPKAAGTGLNITAANHVIHYNPEWNPAVTDQASARSYRRKQTRPVTIHHLFLAGTIEEAIINRSMLKRELAEGAVRDSEGEQESSLVRQALEFSPAVARTKG